MRNVFVYYGNVERLRVEAVKYSQSLNEKYHEVFGAERYEKLADIVEKTLTPESFFDSADKVQERLHQKFQSSAPSRFIIATPNTFSLGADHKPQEKSITLSLGFYISEQSFQNSGCSNYTDKIIASYVHEFNHFAWLALQKVPVYLTGFYLASEIGQMRSLEDILSLAESLSIDARPMQLKRTLMANGITAFMMNNSFEQVNRILDKQILQSIGINAPIPWRGKPKEYLNGQLLDIFKFFSFPVAGDLFYGDSDKQIFRKFLEWERYLGPISNESRIHCLIEAIKKMKVELVPLSVLEKIHN